MTKYIIEESTLTGMANQIRALTGTTGPLKPGEMVTKIEASAEVQEENFTDLAEQDELIEQIFTALEGKATTGGSTSKMISVTNVGAQTLYYLDSDKHLQEASPNTTFSTLDGIVMYIGIYRMTVQNGSHEYYSNGLYQTLKFNENGGSCGVSTSGGGAAE